MNMGRKRRIKIRTNRHHIVPRSRGGIDSSENISTVDIRMHQYYHALFDNRTPPEIINYLVNRCWNGEWGYVNDAIEKYT